MRLFKIILFQILVLVCISMAARTALTPKEALNFTYPQYIVPSPDGQKVAFIVRTPDFQNSKWEYHLWWSDVATSDTRRIAFADGNEYAPQWSPDGQWLTFLSSRTGYLQEGKHALQLWALPVDGGEARQLSQFSTGVQDYRWLPDGSAIIVASELPLPDSLQQKRERLTHLKFDAVVKDSGEVRYGIYRLNPFNLQSTLIAEVDAGFREFDIFPDGRWLIYETNYTGKYDDEQKFDLWLLDLSSGKQVQLTNYPGPEYQPRFSKDGKYIYYINQTTPDIEFAEWDMARIPFSTTLVPVSQADTLTRDLNRAVQTYQVMPDGNTLLLQVADGVTTHIMQFYPHRRRNRYRTIGDGEANYASIHAVSQGTIYALKETATTLPEIVRLRKGKETQVTHFSSRLNAFQLGKQQVVRWKSVDGQEIEGLLILPVNFDPHKRYPLVVTVHGGPYGRFRNTFRQAYYHQVYANRGFVVFAPNPRGSSGYDDAFGKAIWYKTGGHMGGIDYQDIMQGVDALIAKGFVDSTRMGVIGGSYGGYLTNWIISQTHRFAAAVSQFGIFSLFTDWSNSWQPSWEKMYLGIYYWEHPINEGHPYVQYSPAFHVTNIQTPVLILHGEKDKYTNLANSQEMYQALHTLGRPVKFVIYPREGHGLSREPNHRLDVLRRSLRWFEQHLKK